MTILVAIYFICLTLHFWRINKGVSIGVYMSAIYAFSSVCACVLVQNQMLDVNSILYSNSNLKLDIIPTFFYCSLITLTIAPFAKLKINNIKQIQKSTFYTISIFLVTVAVISAIVSFTQIVTALNSDLSAIRAMHYAGDIENITAPFPFNIFLYFSFATILLLPLSFYSICFMNNKWWFNTILIFGSLCRVTQGIIRADRSEFVFFFMMVVLCVIIFQNFIHRKQKRFLSIFGIPLVIIFVSYVASVTIARFGERDSGASGGAIEYAGQSYLNFCYYYENRNENYSSYERFFPITSYILFNDVYTPEDREDRSLKHGFFTAIFPSFIGVLLLDTGLIFTIVWVLAFYLIAKLYMPRGNTLDFGRLLIIFALAVIPIFGVFFYKYNSLSSSVFLIFVLMLSVLLRYKFVVK